MRGRLLMALSVMLLAACGGTEPMDSDDSAALKSDQPTVSTRPQGLGSTNKVLILSGTVTGGTNSPEAKAAKALGYTVDVVNDAVWGAKTSADFATYRAIILGDPTCSTNGALLSAAVTNKNVWGAVVDGNVIIVGTDPVYHPEGPQLTTNAVKFAAAQEGKTGIYVNLSCYYHDTAANTAVPVLDPFGTFTVTGVGCYDDAHIVATHDALSGLTDTILSNWSCSVHEAFDSYPAANFTPLVIARDPAYGSRLPGSKDFADGTHGVPYVMARGAIPVRCGDGTVQYPEECDLGTQNGVPGKACSSVCRLHWCGDGILDSGEECDTGAGNGSGSCSASCKTVAAVNHPPVAKCKDAATAVNETCTMVSGYSIDNGSYDPDGNLAGCTVSGGPNPLSPTGVSQATLTCTDKAGLSSSCTANVTVYDFIPPTITCKAPQTAECYHGGILTDRRPQSTWDNCGNVTISPWPAPDFYYQLGTTVTTFTITDAVGNKASCSQTFTVLDHVKPDLQLYGPTSVTMACGDTPSWEQGYQALDECDGADPVVRSGTVNDKVPGTYVVTYTSKDQSGNVSTATRTVTVTPSAKCQEQQGGWILTGSMALPRLQHTATKLDDGRVLVAGGYNTTSEVYDPTAKTWSTTGSNLGTHRGHTATKLQNGSVLVAGGGVCPLTSTTAELYVPAAGKWKAANPLNAQRYYHAAVLLPNGKVLVAGGFPGEFGGNPLSSAELYDPATGVWTYTGSLNQARGFHTMTLLTNGKVLVTGGATDGDANGLLASAELYDPATGKWTLAAGLSTGRALHTASLLANGQVLVVGGGGLDIARSASAELYDPATNTWSSAGSMTSPRQWHTAVVLNDGRVLVAGGYHPLTGIMTSSELYSPATGKWSVTAAMNVDRYRHTLTLLDNGTALAVGGASNHNQASAEYYSLGSP